MGRRNLDLLRSVTSLKDVRTPTEFCAPDILTSSKNNSAGISVFESTSLKFNKIKD
jgi:hypothetical protein